MIESTLPNTVTILERSRDIVITRWNDLLDLRKSGLNSFDLDEIHDLRVASRRFRATLELFYPFIPNATRTELKQNVRQLTRILGDLRNIDEAALFFQQHPPTGISADRLNRLWQDLREKELKQVKKTVRSFDVRKLGRMVRKALNGLHQKNMPREQRSSLIPYFSDLSIRHYLQIQRLLSASTAPDDRSERHAARIAIKKWRYFLETVIPILGQDYSLILGLLKEYQTLLGSMNDIVEFGKLAEKLSLSAGEQAAVAATLATEESRLLENYRAMLGQTPLPYSFSL